MTPMINVSHVDVAIDEELLAAEDARGGRPTLLPPSTLLFSGPHVVAILLRWGI